MGGSYVGDLGQTIVLQRMEDSPVKTEGTDTSANFGESNGKGTSATRKLKARGCSTRPGGLFGFAADTFHT